MHHFVAELQKSRGTVFLILVAMPLHSVFCISVLYNPYCILYTAEPNSNARLEIECGEDALVQLVALQRRSPVNCFAICNLHCSGMSAADKESSTW